MAIFKKKGILLLLKLGLVCLLACSIFLGIALSILGGESKFSDIYGSTIQRKYEHLKNTEGPKILIIGGSNASFGIDARLLETETGYPVANMALHAGFGPLFNTEIAKKHIEEGDIVLLAHEYALAEFSMSQLADLNLIMSSIDTKLEMYTQLPLKNLMEVFGNLIEYAKYKATKTSFVYGLYSSDSFDEEGNMTFKRETSEITDYERFKRSYGEIYGDSLVPPDETILYLNDFRNYVESKGAKVYFIAPVLLENAYNGTDQQLADYVAEMEQRTGIPYITDPADYLFPMEYMFDLIYHCNGTGQYKRTSLLIEDLREYGIIA